MKKSNNKGFTLVELIATIVILSIVLSIGAFSIIKIINNSKEKEYELLIRNIRDASELYYQECKYSDTMVLNCFYDFNFDGDINDKDVTILENCIQSSFDGSECLLVKEYGDVNLDGVINDRDVADMLWMYLFPEKLPLKKGNKFFVNLERLVQLGYLTASDDAVLGEDGKLDFILLNSKTGVNISNCLVYVLYDGKIKITPNGNLGVESNGSCPTIADYNKYLGE